MTAHITDLPNSEKMPTNMEEMLTEILIAEQLGADITPFWELVAQIEQKAASKGNQ